MRNKKIILFTTLLTCLYAFHFFWANLPSNKNFLTVFAQDDANNGYDNEYEDDDDLNDDKNVEVEVIYQQNWIKEFKEITAGDAADSAPCISLDGKYIIFQSNRDHESRFSLYQSFLRHNKWTTPQEIILNPKSKFEGLPFFSGKDQVVFYTAISKKNFVGEDTTNIAADIWMAKNKKGKWVKPKKLPRPINSQFEEITPWVSFDGRNLYFSSNREGGHGGFDIWVSQHDGTSWGPPINLGSDINSAGNEVYPRVQPDNNILYFSSDKANAKALGSYDIYVSKKFGSQWQKSFNAGSKINSKKNDFINSFPAQGDFLLMSRGNEGEEKIYKVQPIPAQLRFKPVILFNLIVVDKTSGKEIPFKVEIKNINKKTQIFQRAYYPQTSSSKNNNSNGDLQKNKKFFQKKGLFISLETKTRYSLLIQSKGYLFADETLDLRKFSSFNIKRKLKISKIKVGGKVRLNSLYFMPNSPQLNKDSKLNVFRVARFLAKNPNLKIEIQGHTAQVGKHSVNNARRSQKLSYERARSVYNMLVHYGIKKRRLSTKGFGYTKPIRPNNSLANLQKNRRVEFKIIGL